MSARLHEGLSISTRRIPPYCSNRTVQRYTLSYIAILNHLKHSSDRLSDITMDLCPPEILLNIFALACVDGGRTGCSLSLVSHRIYVASFPARYHTVALWGFPRMCIFQKTLAAMSSHPPAVHHLFIYDGHDVPITGTDVLEVATSIISTLAQSLVTLAGSLSLNLHGVEHNSVIAGPIYRFCKT